MLVKVILVAAAALLVTVSSASHTDHKNEEKPDKYHKSTNEHRLSEENKKSGHKKKNSGDHYGDSKKKFADHENQKYNIKLRIGNGVSKGSRRYFNVGGDKKSVSYVLQDQVFVPWKGGYSYQDSTDNFVNDKESIIHDDHGVYIGRSFPNFNLENGIYDYYGGSRGYQNGYGNNVNLVDGYQGGNYGNKFLYKNFPVSALDFRGKSYDFPYSGWKNQNVKHAQEFAHSGNVAPFIGGVQDSGYDFRNVGADYQNASSKKYKSVYPYANLISPSYPFRKI